MTHVHLKNKYEYVKDSRFKDSRLKDSQFILYKEPYISINSQMIHGDTEKIHK